MTGQCQQCGTTDLGGSEHPTYGWLCARCAYRQHTKDEQWRTPLAPPDPEQ